MTERLSDITERLEGYRSLGSVVTAMNAIAGARARKARDEIRAVDSYAVTINEAMTRMVSTLPTPVSPAPETGRSALLVFGAEQGFAGAFTARVLDTLSDADASSDLFLVGTRAEAIAEFRKLSPAWCTPMPSHSAAIPKFADRLLQPIYEKLATGDIGKLEAVYSIWQSNTVRVDRISLFPFHVPDAAPDDGPAPLLYMPVEQLLAELGADYMHAMVCRIALHAFAAENEARMLAMSMAQRQIEKDIAELEARERQVRQEAITAELIELSAGVQASLSPQK